MSLYLQPSRVMRLLLRLMGSAYRTRDTGPRWHGGRSRRTNRGGRGSAPSDGVAFGTKRGATRRAKRSRARWGARGGTRGRPAAPPPRTTERESSRWPRFEIPRPTNGTAGCRVRSNPYWPPHSQVGMTGTRSPADESAGPCSRAPRDTCPSRTRSSPARRRDCDASRAPIPTCPRICNNVNHSQCDTSTPTGRLNLRREAATARAGR